MDKKDPQDVDINEKNMTSLTGEALPYAYSEDKSFDFEADKADPDRKLLRLTDTFNIISDTSTKREELEKRKKEAHGDLTLVTTIALQRRIEELDEEIRNLKIDIKAFREQIGILDGRIEHASARMAECKAECADIEKTQEALQTLQEEKQQAEEDFAARDEAAAKLAEAEQSRNIVTGETMGVDEKGNRYALDANGNRRNIGFFEDKLHDMAEFAGLENKAGNVTELKKEKELSDDKCAAYGENHLEKLQESIEAAKQKLGGADERLATLRTEISALEDQLKTDMAQRDILTQQLAEKQERLAEAEKEREACEAELKSRQQHMTHHEHGGQDDTLTAATPSPEYDFKLDEIMKELKNEISGHNTLSQASYNKVTQDLSPYHLGLIENTLDKLDITVAQQPWGIGAYQPVNAPAQDLPRAAVKTISAEGNLNSALQNAFAQSASPDAQNTFAPKPEETPKINQSFSMNLSA